MFPHDAAPRVGVAGGAVEFAMADREQGPSREV